MCCFYPKLMFEVNIPQTCQFKTRIRSQKRGKNCQDLTAVSSLMVTQEITPAWNIYTFGYIFPNAKTHHWLDGVEKIKNVSNNLLINRLLHMYRVSPTQGESFPSGLLLQEKVTRWLFLVSLIKIPCKKHHTGLCDEES